MEDFGDLDKQFRCRGGAESLTEVGLREKGEESQYVLGYRGAEKWSGTWKGKLNQGIFFFKDGKNCSILFANRTI